MVHASLDVPQDGLVSAETGIRVAHNVPALAQRFEDGAVNAVWADAGSGLEIRALNVGREYYFAVEAFGENGVSGLSDVIHTPP